MVNLVWTFLQEVLNMTGISVAQDHQKVFTCLRPAVVQQTTSVTQRAPLNKGMSQSNLIQHHFQMTFAILLSEINADCFSLFKQEMF